MATVSPRFSLMDFRPEFVVLAQNSKDWETILNEQLDELGGVKENLENLKSMVRDVEKKMLRPNYVYLGVTFKLEEAGLSPSQMGNIFKNDFFPVRDSDPLIIMLSKLPPEKMLKIHLGAVDWYLQQIFGR